MATSEEDVMAIVGGTRRARSLLTRKRGPTGGPAEQFPPLEESLKRTEETRAERVARIQRYVALSHAIFPVNYSNGLIRVNN